MYYSFYTYHSFFIHSSVNGHLDCFHILAIVSSAAMNIGVHGSFPIMVFSGYMPSSGISGLYSSFIPERKERKGFPGGSDSKESTYNAGDQGLIPGLGRAPGGGHGHSSILAWRIAMDRGAWWATVHGPQRVRHDSTTKHSTAYITFSGKHLTVKQWCPRS